MIGPKSLIMILLFLVSRELFAQMTSPLPAVNFEDIAAMQLHPVHQHNYASALKESRNEFQFLLTGFFVLYKNYISTQDERSCTFTPSCSVYAIQTIRKHGAIVGFLDAIDRLSRCNGLSPEKYDIDKEQSLLIDNP